MRNMCLQERRKKVRQLLDGTQTGDKHMTMNLDAMIQHARANVGSTEYAVKNGNLMVKAERVWRGPKIHTRVKCYIDGAVVSRDEAAKLQRTA